MGRASASGWLVVLDAEPVHPVHLFPETAGIDQIADERRRANQEIRKHQECDAPENQIRRPKGERTPFDIQDDGRRRDEQEQEYRSGRDRTRQTARFTTIGHHEDGHEDCQLQHRGGGEKAVRIRQHRCDVFHHREPAQEKLERRPHAMEPSYQKDDGEHGHQDDEVDGIGVQGTASMLSGSLRLPTDRCRKGCSADRMVVSRV